MGKSIMTTDTEKRLAEIRERAEKATKGPLHAVKQPQILGGEYEVRIQNGMEIAFVTKLEDATLFSASVDDIPFLLAVIERLTDQLERLTVQYQGVLASIDNQSASAVNGLQAKLAEMTAERDAALEALREIARPTIGHELCDTDEQRADHFEKLWRIFQGIARAALSPSTLNKPE